MPLADDERPCRTHRPVAGQITGEVKQNVRGTGRERDTARLRRSDAGAATRKGQPKGWNDTTATTKCTCNDMNEVGSRPISRVLSMPESTVAAIPLGGRVTTPLKQPTREQREPRHCSPIWPCSGWGLPCRPALAPDAVGSYPTISPLPGVRRHRRYLSVAGIRRREGCPSSRTAV